MKIEKIGDELVIRLSFKEDVNEAVFFYSFLKSCSKYDLIGISEIILKELDKIYEQMCLDENGQRYKEDCE